jgi:hypothetical protein
MRRALPWLATWVGLWWLWMLLVGEWDATEWIAAAVTAAVATTGGRIAWREGGRRVRVPLRTILSARSVPPAILVDFGIVMYALGLALVRRRVPRGVFLARPFDASGDDPTSVGARVWRTFTAMYSPNAYVVDVDCERGTVLLHDLIENRSSEAPA